MRNNLTSIPERTLIRLLRPCAPELRQSQRLGSRPLPYWSKWPISPPQAMPLGAPALRAPQCPASFRPSLPSLPTNAHCAPPRARARKREAVPLCGRRHLRYRVGRRSPHQIRRGAAQNPVSPTLPRAILLHRAILLPFSRPTLHGSAVPLRR